MEGWSLTPQHSVSDDYGTAVLCKVPMMRVWGRVLNHICVRVVQRECGLRADLKHASPRGRVLPTNSKTEKECLTKVLSRECASGLESPRSLAPVGRAAVWPSWEGELDAHAGRVPASPPRLGGSEGPYVLLVLPGLQFSLLMHVRNFVCCLLPSSL